MPDGIAAESLGVCNGAPNVDIFMPSIQPPAIVKARDFADMKGLADHLNALAAKRNGE